MTYQQTWDAWKDVHDDPEQQKRIKSAYKADLTPVEISPDEGKATFSGHSGVYTTTLAKCTCVDFARRKLPCKHMYRLAIELGLFGDREKAENDPSKIKIPLGKKQDVLFKIVAQIENYSDDTQKAIKQVLSDYKYKWERNNSYWEDGRILQPAIDDGLLIARPGYDHFMENLYFRKAELIDFLKSYDIEIPPTAKYVRDLQQILSDHSEEIGKKKFPNALEVRPNTELAAVTAKAYSYLHRKYDPDARQGIAYDEDGEPLTCDEPFPDDDVSQLLLLYGHITEKDIFSQEDYENKHKITINFSIQRSEEEKEDSQKSKNEETEDREEPPQQEQKKVVNKTRFKVIAFGILAAALIYWTTILMITYLSFEEILIVISSFFTYQAIKKFRKEKSLSQ